ncbi:MAG TPA: class I SAM-dependent methyltransferase [Steroidobacteraceae bacterium]|nr:class I SAM-dependent methyltransferase [Steroidobacteraceae bacterium]
MTTGSLSDIMLANIEVHTRMVEQYNNEPHFRPENQAKVRRVLEDLAKRTGGGRMLDVGCGTGFVIHLAKDLFARIDGVDVTPAMLAKIDTSSGNITLHNQPAESLPFAAGSFDAVTSYAFLHHLEDYVKVLREAHRVLRPGGMLYVDLEPNREFWRLMTELERSERAGERFSDIVQREIKAVLHTDEQVSRDFGIDEETFNKAEYTKAVLGGIDAQLFARQCREIGFSECQVVPQWFLGQGTVMHGQSFEAAAVIEDYLVRVQPLSLGLFKYLRFLVRK